MAKFSLQKEIKEKLTLLEADRRFHEAMAADLKEDFNNLLEVEKLRTGNQGKKIRNVDLNNGELEVDDLIVGKS